MKKTISSKIVRETKRLLYQLLAVLNTINSDDEFDRKIALELLEKNWSKGNIAYYLFSTFDEVLASRFTGFIYEHGETHFDQCTENLMRGMDEISQATVKRFAQRYKILAAIETLNGCPARTPGEKCEKSNNGRKWGSGMAIPATFLKSEADFILEIDLKKQSFQLPKYDLLEKYKIPLDILVTQANMEFIPHEYWMIEGRDVLDCGGFIGDTALIYADLKARSVHVFEPERNTRKALEEVILRNSKSQTIIPLPFATSDKRETVRFYTDGEMDGGSSILNRDSYTTAYFYDVECITIDEYVEKHSLDVGLIKMDVEGAEYASIQGALETIKKFKPNLVISLYHTPKDFFEIKTVLESLDVGYIFLTRQLPYYAKTMGEVELIAYTK